MLAAFLLAGISFTYFFHLREVVALDGFSILEFLAQKTHPENFARDFPGGTMAATASILTELYYPLQQLTHLSGLTLMSTMIWLEIASVFAAAWVFWRFTDLASDNLHAWGYAWLCMVLCLSSVISPDLANFKFPYFHGQFYGYADALRLVAIVFALRRQWAWTALLICLAFTIHPIKTIGAGIFILAAVLIDAKNAVSFKSLFWGAVTATFCGLWAYYWLGIGRDTGATPIEPAEFISYTRIFQSHWYPLDLGLISNGHPYNLSPFLALMVMACVALYQTGLSPILRKQILAGYALTAVVVAGGIYLSTQIVSPTLIKLSLARASDLMTLLAPFFIVAALIAKWRTENWAWVALYAVFLIGGFTGTLYMAPGLAIIAVGMLGWELRKSGHDMPRTPFLLGALLLAATIALWLFNPETVNPFVLTAKRFAIVLAAWGLLVLIGRVPNWMRLNMSSNHARILCLTAAFLLSGAVWAAGKLQRSPEYISKGNDFYAVQMWANANTPSDALFMVDPCQIYGWRDFSERASIGTPREWFMTGWIYMTDGRTLNRGKEISQALGLDMNKYIAPATEKPITDSQTICKIAQESYYDPSRQVYARMSKNFGVDYFVLEKPKSDAVTAPLKTQPLFSNNHYSVYTAKDLIP